MKITLLTVGKTADKDIDYLVGRYKSRLKHYVKFDERVVVDLKTTRSLSKIQQKEMEGNLILNALPDNATVILLEERGKEYSSLGFAQFLDSHQLKGTKELIFIVGGPYGFSEKVYDRANDKISFSRMTLTHEMIRLFFTEQVYRAFTIIRGEKYHHE